MSANLKPNDLFELNLQLKFDDLETLPALLQKARESIDRIQSTTLHRKGGKLSRSHQYAAGSYNFSLRDKTHAASTRGRKVKKN